MSEPGACHRTSALAITRARVSGARRSADQIGTLDAIVDEFVRLNGRRVQSYYRLGFPDV